MAYRIPVKVQRLPLHKNASLKDKIARAIRPSIAIHSNLDMFFDPKQSQKSWLLVNALLEKVNKGAIIDEMEELIDVIIHSE